MRKLDNLDKGIVERLAEVKGSISPEMLRIITMVAILAAPATAVAQEADENCPPTKQGSSMGDLDSKINDLEARKRALEAKHGSLDTTEPRTTVRERADDSGSKFNDHVELWGAVMGEGHVGVGDTYNPLNLRASLTPRLALDEDWGLGTSFNAGAWWATNDKSDATPFIAGMDIHGWRFDKNDNWGFQVGARAELYWPQYKGESTYFTARPSTGLAFGNEDIRLELSTSFPGYSNNPAFSGMTVGAGLMGRFR